MVSRRILYFEIYKHKYHWPLPVKRYTTKEGGKWKEEDNNEDREKKIIGELLWYEEHIYILFFLFFHVFLPRPKDTLKHSRISDKTGERNF
jgi:hypothetical protein